MTYVDSSAMVAIYVTERFSKAARAAVRRASQIPYTPLHQLEVPNAFEMLLGRDAITREECHAIVEQLREDVSRAAVDDGVTRLGSGVCARRRAVQALHG